MQQHSVKTDTACALYQTGACAALNQRSCENCPAHADGHAHAKETAKFVEQFQSLLPGEGIAHLFESETCELCKTEPRGRRDGFAIVDFGHSEPEALQQRKLFFKNDVGFMVPLQFACCRKCRMRMLLCAYLPLGLAVLLTALTLPVLLNPHAAAALRAVAGWLPLLLAVGAAGIGFAAGRILQNVLRQRFEASMYIRVLEHPAAREMRAKGWFPLSQGKFVQPVFTKKRIRFGLGTASSAQMSAHAETDETPEE